MRHHSRLHLERDGWRALRLAFLDDNTLVACGWQPRDPLLRLWLIDSSLLHAGGAPLRRMIDTGGPRLGTVTLAADGALVACGYSPPSLEPGQPCGRVWALPRGRLIAELATGERPAAALALAFAGAGLLAAGHDDAISLWSLADGARLALLPGACGGLVTALAGADNALAAAAETAVVRLWRLPDGAPLRPFDAGQGVCALALSADGSRLACATGTSSEARRAYERGAAFAHSVEVWSLDSVPRRLAAAETAVPACDLRFAPAGARLAAACGDLLLWDAAAGALAARLPGGQGRGYTAAAFAPGGGLLAAGGSGRVIDVWELED